MDNSYESTTTSLTEYCPLLDKSPAPLMNNRDTQRNLRASIFNCAVVSILFTELCERLTFYGITGNLVYFATRSDHLNMSSTGASVLAYVFQGTCFTLPILGGWLADTRAGKFSMIWFSVVIYLLGALLLPFGSIARNDNNGEKSQWAANDVTTNPIFMKVFYITGLFLVAFGTGGMKANVSLFGAQQVSYGGPAAIEAFFRWFYWFTNIGAFLAFTFVVYIQQNVSFFYGNLIPAFPLILALIIFLNGKWTYVRYPPHGNVITDTLSIMKEAIKKSRRPSISSVFLNHWLDRAKLCFGGSYSSWEVEDVKKVCRLLPIFGSFIFYWTVWAQMYTSMVYQGKNMDIQINGHDIPIASLNVFNTLSILVLIPIIDNLVYPLLAKFEICPSQLQRIGFGMIIATGSMVCAGGLEWVRVKQCCMYQDRPGEHNENGTQVANIKIFYQVPQYTLIGLSEIFTSVTGMELTYTEAPQSLQGVMIGVFLLTLGLGNFAGAALLGIVNGITEAVSGVEGKWYPDQNYVNKSPHLAYYFFLLAGLMFLNFILYVFVALSFKKKKESVSRSNGVVNKYGKPPRLFRKNESDDGCWTSVRPAANNSAL